MIIEADPFPGTGTGLLSLLAVEAGADNVKTLEVFRPVAEIAKKIFEQQAKNRIDLVISRSSDIKSGPDSKVGNILVAEVFDTELIGEGALRTFKEAHGTLVEVIYRDLKYLVQCR